MGCNVQAERSAESLQSHRSTCKRLEAATLRHPARAIIANIPCNNTQHVKLHTNEVSVDVMLRDGVLIAVNVLWSYPVCNAVTTAWVGITTDATPAPQWHQVFLTQSATVVKNPIDLKLWKVASTLTLQLVVPTDATQTCNACPELRSS
jgi:hypothetical protein